MDITAIIGYLKSINKEVLLFCCTTLIGILSWLVKSLIEGPLTSSKETFNRLIDKRLEVLMFIKTRLLFISYSEDLDESKKIKEELQSILKEGKVAYLSQQTYADVVRISIDLSTNKKLVLSTIQDIDRDMYKQINKVKGEIDFYITFSHFSPLKRIFSLFLMSFLYIVSITICLALLSVAIYQVIFGTIVTRIFTIVLVITIISILNWLFSNRN